MSKMSTTARDELVGALARRCAVGTRAEKTRILDEFQAVTGFHRKQAMPVPHSCATRCRAEGKACGRIYDDAARDALVVFWEASGRICGKRLKTRMPTLVEAMERHGHPRLGPEIRAGLLAMSPATIDRSLRKVRERAGGRRAVQHKAGADRDVRRNTAIHRRRLPGGPAGSMSEPPGDAGATTRKTCTTSPRRTSGSVRSEKTGNARSIAKNYRPMPARPNGYDCFVPTARPLFRRSCRQSGKSAIHSTGSRACLP